MGSRYKNVLNILEKWPVDQSKSGRDLGQHIRERVKQLFNTERGFVGDPTTCDKHCDSLRRLTNDIYFKQYQRTKTYSASGLNAQQCHQLLENESLKLFEEESKGMLKKLLSK